MDQICLKGMFTVENGKDALLCASVIVRPYIFTYCSSLSFLDLNVIDVFSRIIDENQILEKAFLISQIRSNLFKKWSEIYEQLYGY